MQRPTVLFDLDGTLIFSSDAIRSSISRTMVEFGLEPLNTDNIKYFIGVPLAEALGHWTDDPRPMVDRYRQIYLETYREKTTVYDGVIDMLEAIRGKVDTAIITLKSGAVTRQVLDAFGLGTYFENIYGDEGPGASKYGIKPKPQHFFFALLDMGLISEDVYDRLKDESDLRGKEVPFEDTRVLYLGDTEADMIGARRAGISPIGATWGLREKQQLLDAGAETTVDDPGQFLELLRELGFLD
jgi:phosphoglycolate phosphatase